MSRTNRKRCQKWEAATRLARLHGVVLIAGESAALRTKRVLYVASLYHVEQTHAAIQMYQRKYSRPWIGGRCCKPMPLRVPADHVRLANAEMRRTRRALKRAGMWRGELG